MKKYQYKILDLDCANCARKIEESLNKNDLFNDVVVNFNTSRMSFYADDKIPLDKINSLVRAVEDEVTIVDLDSIEKEEKKEYNLFILVLAVAIGFIGIKLDNQLGLLLTILSYIMLLYKTTLNAIKMFIKSFDINENLLISISCIGAFLVNQKEEGIMVVALYTIGKILEEKAINKTRGSISDLLNIKQDYANLQDGKEITKVDVETLKVGDLIIVKKGEKIPVDGIIFKGKAKIDTSVITGEAEYVEVEKNDTVLSGSINTSDVITVKVSNKYEDSTVSKIIELVENATDKKAKTETFVAKLSKIYTPIIILLAILVAFLLPVITNIAYQESIYRALTFLVISCPCAIAISVPLSYFCGIGVASRDGILIKGSNYLDRLSKTTKIVFDKTGTLTTGSFKVTGIDIMDKNYSEEEIIEILRNAEAFSTHPIAKSIMNLSNKKTTPKKVKNYQEIPGIGISCELDNKKIKIGTKKICNKCLEKTNIHLNIDGKHVASVDIYDGIKENVSDTIKKLKDKGIKTYMFTGDKKEAALTIGKKLNIDHIKYEMLPTDKYNEYEKLTGPNEVVLFVGDGVNDAPVLKRSDIGISMGGVGSSIAISSSDIVIMKDDISKINDAINISNNTIKIIKQNLIFAIGVKILILLLSVVGLANMYMAVFADTGVTLLTILNTLRLMKRSK